MPTGTPTGAWNYYAATAASATSRRYQLNANPPGTSTASYAPGALLIFTLAMWTYPSENLFWDTDGSIDECRGWAVAQTNDWNTAEYHALHDAATFARVGTVVPQTQTQTLGGTVGSTGTCGRVPAHHVGGTLSATGAASKATTATRSGGLTPISVAARTVSTRTAGILASSGAVVLQGAGLRHLVLSGAIAGAGSIARVAGLALRGAVSASAVIRRTSTKPMGGTLHPLGLLQRLLPPLHLTGLLALIGQVTTRITQNTLHGSVRVINVTSHAADLAHVQGHAPQATNVRGRGPRLKNGEGA